jgi:hypothetical protein
VGAPAELLEILERKTGRTINDARKRSIDMPLDSGLHLQARLRCNIPARDKEARQRFAAV